MTRDPTRPIRVLMVMPSYYPIVGGMEVQVADQIPYLREHGIDATILTRQTAGTSRSEMHDGVEIRRLPIPGGPGMKSISFSALGTVEVLRNRRQIDIVHAHSIMSPMTVAGLGGRLTSKPRLVTIHGSHEPSRLLTKPFGERRLQLSGSMLNRFVSISSQIRQLLLDHGIPAGRITSIPNGIDTSTFAPACGSQRKVMRAELGLAADTPIVVFAGRLQSVKNVDVLLRAWAGVAHGQLVILGNGDEGDRLHALSRELDLGPRVSFRGMVPNVADYLRVSDIFVLPSSSEGLSVALLEAMASGLVPVATAIGGTTDVVQHDQTGLLVEPGDVDGLRAALSHALTADEWRATAAQAARQRAVERYDLRVVSLQLADLYRELLGRQ